MISSTIAPLRAWSARRWGVAAAAASVGVVVVGVPTDLVDTGLFTRMEPVTWWAWPSLLVASVLSGLLVATYVDPPAAQGGDPGASRRGLGAGFLTWFAVGCPVCNKLVLLALGSAGATTFFAPLQPVLQLAALGLLVWALRTRLRGETACRAPRAPANA